MEKSTNFIDYFLNATFFYNQVFTPLLKKTLDSSIQGFLLSFDVALKRISTEIVQFLIPLQFDHSALCHFCYLWIKLKSLTSPTAKIVFDQAIRIKNPLHYFSLIK
ncbi:hypothetical protein [Bacillus sp. cl95]|uniref:hypothetical protein n=1 Tax=Bacillus sp. cl95 TaxID=1761761 RepID=UPI000B8067DD|nr:hypothetical protein [Bacillus sp. cl95]